MRSDAETTGAGALWPTLTGHEGTTFIAEAALAVLGPPLGAFITRTMQGLTPSHRGVADRWAAGREERTNPADTRMLIKELGRFWPVLSPRFSSRAPGGEILVRRVHEDLERYRVMPIANRAKHGANLTPGETLRLVVFARHVAILIGADDVSRYLEPLTAVLVTREKAFGSRRPVPDADPVSEDVICFGAHWAQPKKHVPGSWWLVAVQGGRNSLVEADLTSTQLVEIIASAKRASCVGLAYCFSAPAAYLMEQGFTDPAQLWEQCRPFSSRSMAKAVTRLGEPFRVVAPGAPMRSPEDEPEAFRATEKDINARLHVTPSSIFDVSGTDSVGALAVNGMPILTALSDKGAAIWPFAAPRARGMTCVEIFPRALWATLNPREDPRSKKNQHRRRAYIAAQREGGLRITDHDADIVEQDERAFDALVTARSLQLYGGGISSLHVPRAAALEGQIWLPR